MSGFPRKPEGVFPSALPPGLRGYWPLDDGVGAYAADWSGLRNPAQKVGTSQAVGRDGRPCLSFNGTSTDYLTLGGAPKAVGLKQFTICCWFYRTAAGATMSTGTGGLTMVPLVTHGLGEADGSNLDCNWALGIVSASNVIGCDFESYDTSSNNNPASGVTAVSNNVWYHAAATFDGGSHKIYLNGRLEIDQRRSQIPRSDSIQHVGIGTAMNSGGTRTGFFAGRLQDAMVFCRALSPEELRVAMLYPHTLPRRRVFGHATNSYSLSCDVGVCTATGNAATLAAGRRVASAVGTHAVSGGDSSIIVGRRIAAATKLFTLIFQPASLRITGHLDATGGVFSHNGMNANLTHGRRIGCDGAALTWTGTAASLIYAATDATVAGVVVAGQVHVAGSRFGQAFVASGVIGEVFAGRRFAGQVFTAGAYLGELFAAGATAGEVEV